MAAAATAPAACASCHNPLTVTIDAASPSSDIQMGNSSSPTSTVPDDVHLLACGCHFHWQCLLDAYSFETCPSCSTGIVTHNGHTQQLLCDLKNEGGLQRQLDILPFLAEESYLKAYPEERRARMFLEFCRAGDLGAVVDMLKDDNTLSDDDDDEEDLDEAFENDDDDDNDTASTSSMQPSRPPPRQIDLLRYQDPIGEMQSALHAAVEARSREVAWLLLLLASRLDLMEFPALVFQEAASIGLMRDDAEVAAKSDIRAFRDARGRTAEEIAREVGGVWDEWLGKGWLAV